MKPFLIVDIEANGLNPDKIWCVVTKEYNSGKVQTFLENSEDALRYIRSFLPVGHFLLGYDAPVLNRLWNLGIDYKSCIDTLVLSRLRNSWDVSDHSLEAWGQRLGEHKKPFSDFSKFSEEMVEYCQQDVEVTYKLFKYLEPWWSDRKYWKSIRLEHDSAILCKEMEDNGFCFDTERAKSLLSEVQRKLQELTDDIQKEIKPRVIPGPQILPKPTKNNTISLVNFKGFQGSPEESGYSIGAPFSRFHIEPFNVGSPKQRIDVLWEAGWKPTNKTKGHIDSIRARDFSKKDHFERYGWKCDEENLSTLPSTAPAGARRLVEWIVLDSRRSTLEEWLGQVQNGRIHGTYNHIGAWTHRKSHARPNKANIPQRYVGSKPFEERSPVEQIKSIYDGQFRELWCASEGKKLVGVDAEGIQLRILAHYLDNQEYAEAIVSGKKEDKTDIHSVNQKALGDVCKTRDDAKTFIYAWLLGARTGKIREILDCSREEAVEAERKFLQSIGGLARLKNEMVPLDAVRGYFIGLDGRIVVCNSEHKMLAGYLQNGESVIMKWACRLWYNQLKKEKVPFWLINDVHDEWVTEVPDDEGIALYVGETQKKAIVQAGIDLGVKCPLAGNAQYGYNWLEVH